MMGIDYRPTKLSEIVGQKTVVKALSNYLKTNTYPQCSVFLGASGNGKSTLSRIVAKTLNCEHPIIIENGIEPCCNCASCKDIENERFQLGVTLFNGSDLSIEKIREIEENIRYTPMGAKNNIIILEESQTIPSVAFRSLLTLIEKKRDNTYFILTSTDKSKFSGSSYASDNKSQEKVALKSRVMTFNIKPTSVSEIEDTLFKILMKIDSDEKLPPTVEEMISCIAMNSCGNLRNAVNDFGSCIDGGIYTKEECMELCGYEDEQKEFEMIYSMLTKSNDTIKYLQNSENINGNFVYWEKIISDSALRKMSDIPCKEEWKENSFQKIMNHANFKSLFNCFSKTSMENSSYWKDSIFINNLYNYYNESNVKPLTTQSTVKKIKRIVEG